MREILGKAKTIRDLLSSVKYSIDYYQREYNWHKKQIQELVEDLSDKFVEDYRPDHERMQVAEYGHYFLGSIIISKKDGGSYIVDGQQRLTSLTLLLLFLRNLQNDRETQVDVDDLIFSEKYGQRSFNVHVEERTSAMEALYAGRPIDTTDRTESVQNLVLRYRDIEECFPEELRGDVLPFFMDWLLENVHLVEITAYSDEDAYTIFETMNDRGLSLSNTDMLKGYLLANMPEGNRTTANTRWRARIHELNEVGKDVEPDYFKAWLRSQYATKIRERKRDARAEDFDRIGTEFHRWLRDAATEIGLEKSDDFYRFVECDFDFFSRHYLRIVAASNSLIPGLEPIFYNGQHGFTLQNMVLLAPLRSDDDIKTVDRKLVLVARYIDIVLTRRIWNFRSIAYSTMQYAMFLVMRDVRRLALPELADKLRKLLDSEQETFESDNAGRFRVHQQNRYAIHRVIARLTDYVETESGQPSKYAELVAEGRNRYEIEHILADHSQRHVKEFSHATEFSEYRNRIGGLLLVPKKFNASYGDLPYADKVPHYLSQNMLARSLHPQCYEHNPGFMQFIERSGLPFRHHLDFKKADIEARSALYREIARRIWNPNDLLEG